MALKYLLPTFIMQNFKIIFTADMQLQESVTFGPNSPQNGPLAGNQNFSRWTNGMFLFYLFTPFITENMNKITRMDFKKINNL